MNKRILAIFVAVVSAVVLLLITAQGCATVTPHPVQAKQASFDGNTQNSGVVSAAQAGFIVTENFRAKYNALASMYGKYLLPPIKPDDGLVKLQDGTWVIYRQYMSDAILMEKWHRMGRLP
jgi:hypothetical protein